MIGVAHTHNIAAHGGHRRAVFSNLVGMATFNQVFVVKFCPVEELIVNFCGTDVRRAPFQVDAIECQHAFVVGDPAATLDHDAGNVIAGIL